METIYWIDTEREKERKREANVQEEREFFAYERFKEEMRSKDNRKFIDFLSNNKRHF